MYYNQARDTAPEINAPGDNHSPPIKFPNTSFSTGPTLGVVHDSRDYILNASEGFLLAFNWSHYHQQYGSDSDFHKVKLNYSDYLHFNNLQSVLAWQWKAELNSGDTPWDQLAKLGGPTNLRGYEAGRYRDENMTLMQLEWRQHLVGRHGAVAWIGAGTLSNDFSELSKGEWLRSVGFGYRFRVKAQSNLRLDMGFGEGEKGFYFTMNEAF